MKKYSAVLLVDDDGIRDILLECMRFSHFDVRGYSEAEKLLEVLSNHSPFSDFPDLVVLDLQLQPKQMQGIELVSELISRDVPSEIAVISGNSGPGEMIEAIKLGASASITKPFENIFDVIKKFEVLAEAGRKRRVYRLGNRPKRMDSTRLVRPVFLSYSTQDKLIANGIRRNLESRHIPVWYAPVTLEIGDEWRSSIEHGVDQAKVFVALITEHYLKSPFCMAELTRFYGNIKRERKRDAIILPVLIGLSDEARKHGNVRAILDQSQYIDLSVRFIDGLTALLARIQKMVGQGCRPVLLSRSARPKRAA